VVISPQKKNVKICINVELFRLVSWREFSFVRTESAELSFIEY